MGVVAFSDQKVWKIARYEYRRLLDAAKPFLDERDDLRALEQAKALDGLHFDMIDEAQTARLRQALHAGADRLARDIDDAADADVRERKFAVRLHELRRFLSAEASSGE